MSAIWAIPVSVCAVGVIVLVPAVRRTLSSARDLVSAVAGLEPLGADVRRLDAERRGLVDHLRRVGRP